MIKMRKSYLKLPQLNKSVSLILALMRKEVFDETVNSFIRYRLGTSSKNFTELTIFIYVFFLNEVSTLFILKTYLQQKYLFHEKLNATFFISLFIPIIFPSSLYSI
jgi:hypothetical protein